MSYEELVTRYKDLSTADVVAAWDEASAIAIRRNEGQPHDGDHERERELRKALKGQFDRHPCKCDCDDVSCECRRCRSAHANGAALYELTGARTPRRRLLDRPSDDAAAPEQRVASARSHATLSKHVYLAVQLAGSDLNTWLINEGDQDFDFTVRTGEYSDGAASSVAVRAPATLPARSTVLFEEDTEFGLDATVWWDIDFAGRGGAVRLMHATRGKYGWGDTDQYTPIPHTNERGQILRLRPRA